MAAGPRWTRAMDQPRVVAKHRLLVDQVYVCDVHSWNDSSDVQHGVSGKLEVTSRRYTPNRTIVHLPRFRLTLSSKADASGELGRFLDRLRSTRQVCEVVFPVLLCRYLTVPNTPGQPFTLIHAHIHHHHHHPHAHTPTHPHNVLVHKVLVPVPALAD